VKGRPRLSPMFVEWMMGLDPGHVTGHGLRPAQELKMLGNGVVPQQAELALRLLLGLDAVGVPSGGDLLPTPVADHLRGLAQPGTDYQSLPNVAISLLPTPEASDGSVGRVSSELGGVRASGAKRAVTLATAVHHALRGDE
jgi:hypothetical protein